MANSARIDDLQKKFDENPRRYFAPLANEYRKAGDPEQAIAICREFLPQQPGHMSGHIVYGQALYDAQQLDEAKVVFDTALTLDPENLIALRYLGDIARGLGDPASARLWYQRVLDADPRNAEISALLTELANAPQAPPAEPPATGPTGTVVMESVSLEGLTGSTPPETEVAAAPADGPVEQAVQPTPAPEAPAAEPVVVSPPPQPPATPEAAAEPPATTAAPPESVAAGAGQEPPEASAPPADELLDLDDLDIASAEPIPPGGDTPRPSFETTGFDIERADDGLLLPTVDAAGAYWPDASLEPEAEVEPEPVSASEPEPEAEPASASEPVSESQEAADGFPLDGLELATQETSPPSAPTPPSVPALDPFATETMAELYRSQGHRDEALRVYRQLLVQRPNDAGLEARIAELEAATEATPAAVPPAQEVPDLDASAFTFESGLGAPEAEHASERGPESAGTNELVIEPPAGLLTDEGLGQTMEQAAAAAAEPAPEAVAEPESEAEAGATRPAAPTGPSIREFLAALGGHVAGGSPIGLEPAEVVDQGSEAAGPVADIEVQAFVAEETVIEVEAEAVEFPVADESGAGGFDLVDVVEVEPQPAADEGAGQPGAEASEGVSSTEAAPGAEPEPAGGSIDLMFDSAGVSEADEAAAEGLAGAYGLPPEAGETPPPTMEGAPARRATEELSLDSVFREQRSSSAPSESRGFSFDKFFANPTPAMGSSIMETPPLGQPSESADDDIEQFNSWLDGLKKR